MAPITSTVDQYYLGGMKEDPVYSLDKDPSPIRSRHNIEEKQQTLWRIGRFRQCAEEME